MNNAPAAVIENKNTNTVILAIIVAKMEGWTVHVRPHSQETLALVTDPERDRRKKPVALQTSWPMQFFREVPDSLSLYYCSQCREREEVGSKKRTEVFIHSFTRF